MSLDPNLPSDMRSSDPRARAIASVTRALIEARERWLNPAELVIQLPEVVTGFPSRTVPKDDESAAILKKRTLTALYNTRGTPEEGKRSGGDTWRRLAAI